jgi:hypothetical protein
VTKAAAETDSHSQTGHMPHFCVMIAAFNAARWIC